MTPVERRAVLEAGVAELEKLAKAATPGPWAYEAHGDTMDYGVGVLIDPCSDGDDKCTGEQVSGVMIVSESVAVEVKGQSNAAFIAAANPKAVLGLIEAIRELSAASPAPNPFEIGGTSQDFYDCDGSDAPAPLSETPKGEPQVDTSYTGQIAALSARNRELEQALRPFAEHLFRVSDLRRAAKIIRELSSASPAPEFDIGGKISPETEAALARIDDNIRNAKANGNMLVGASPAPLSEGKKVYVFDRYINGKKMAEGCRITKAASVEDAIERAKAMYPKNPETVFKLRETSPASPLAPLSEGWQMVPVEPTMEMVEAGRPRPPQWDKTEVSKRIRLQCDEMRRNDWKAMLEAAPRAAISATEEDKT